MSTHSTVETLDVNRVRELLRSHREASSYCDEPRFTATHTKGRVVASSEKPPVSFTIANGQIVSDSEVITSTEAKAAAILSVISSYPKEIREQLNGRIERGFTDNPDVDEAARCIHSARLHNITTTALRKKPLLVHENVSNDMERFLNEKFLGYKIRLTFSKNVAHNNAAALRRVLRFYMRDKVGYRKDDDIPEGYHVKNKDVGASGMDVIADELTDVHCCTPDLDFRDHIRLERLKKYIYSHVCPTSKDHGIICEGFREGSTKYRCENIGQQCYIKAPTLTFVHSAYDITAAGIVDCMIAANAHHAIMCLHFPSAILSGSTSGKDDLLQYKWDIVVEDGIKYYKQKFLNDTQASYVHRLDVYLDKFLTKVVLGSDKRFYMFEITEMFGSVAIIEVFRREKDFIAGSKLTFNIPRTEHPNTVTIHTWEYVTGYESLFKGRNGLKSGVMRPVSIEVPEEFFLSVFKYGMTVDSNKFVYDGLLKSGVGIAARRNIGGTTMVDPSSPIPVRKLQTFIVTMYMLLYQEKWEATQGLVTMKMLADQYRTRSSKNGIVRFLTNVFSPDKVGETQHPSSTYDLGKLGFSHSEDNKFVCDRNLNTEERSRLSQFERLVQWFREFSRVHRKCPIVVHDSTHMLEYVLDIPDMVVQNIKSLRDDLTLSNLCDHDFDAYLPSHIEVNDAKCTKDLTVIQVPGDGNCLYYCFVKACLYRGISVCDLKSRLRDSPYFLEVAKLARDSGEDEFLDSLERDGVYGNKFTLILISKTFNVNICVHLKGGRELITHFISNKGSRFIHLQLEHSHYSLLVPCIKAGLIDEHVLCHGALSMVVPTAHDYRRLVDLYKIYTRDGTIASYFNIFNNSYKGPFLNVYELGFMEIASSLEIPSSSGNKFLITDVWLHHCIKALRVLDPHSNVIVLRSSNTSRIPDRYGVCDFTMDSEFHEESFCLSTTLSDVLNLGIYSQCMVVFSDLSRVPLKPFAPGFRTRTSVAERSNKILLAWSALSSGGTAVFRVFRPEEVPESLNMLTTLFEDIRFFKPKAISTSIVDGYLLCSGKRSHPGSEFSITSEVRNHFYTVNVENFYKQTLEESEVSNYVKDLCGLYAGGGFVKPTRKHSYNRSFVLDRSLILSKLMEFSSSVSFGLFGRKFSTYKLHVGCDTKLKFCNRSIEEILDSQCLHCKYSKYDFNSLRSVSDLASFATRERAVVVETFDDCGDYVSIISFFHKLYSMCFKDLRVVSDCFLNNVVLKSFLAYARCYSDVEISLCQLRGRLLVDITCRSSWYNGCEFGDFELVSCNRHDYDTAFVEVLIQHAMHNQRYNNETIVINSRADAIRAGLSVRKFKPCGDVLDDLNKSVKYKPKFVTYNTESLVNSIKAIVGVGDETTKEPTDNSVVEKPVVVFEKVDSPNLDDRIKAVYEYRSYMGRELSHSNDVLEKTVSNLLRFTETRDPKRLNEMYFPNSSFLSDEMKLKDSVGIITCNGKILKNSEPIVQFDDISAVYDIVNGSVVDKSDYFKMHRGKTTKQVGGFAIYTSLVAHNQVESILKAVDCVYASEKINDLSAISIDWVQAVAGAGKTTLLVETFLITDLVVCPTVENRDSIRLRIKRRYPDLDPKEVDCRVRTINGYLVDFSTKLAKVTLNENTRLLVDEAIMYHAGCLFVLCMIYNIRRMFCVGDKKQIPFVSRIDFKLNYEKLCDFVNTEARPLARTFRSPPDVTYRMQQIYGKSLKGLTIQCLSKNQDTSPSVSKLVITKNYRFGQNFIREVFEKDKIDFDGKNLRILFFLREDMLSFYGNGGMIFTDCCSTIHQFQGSDAEYVVVMRLTYAEKSIFMDERQCLVALTRHTKRMVYVSVNEGTDVLTRWINMPVVESMLVPHLSLSGGGTTTPSRYVTYRSIPSVDLMKGDKCVRVGYHPRSDIILDKRDTLTAVLNKIADARPKGNLVVSSAVLDKFNQQRLKPLLKSIVGHSNIFCAGVNSNINSTVFEVMQLNAVDHVPNHFIDPIFDDDVVRSADIGYKPYRQHDNHDPVLSDYGFDDKFAVIQNFLCTTFPNSCYVLNYMDAWITYNLDLDLAIDDIVINVIKFATIDRTYDCMIPRLSFCSPVVRKACLVESLIAVQKRNRNVPQLSSEVSPYVMADQLFDSLRSLLDERYYQEVHYGPAELAAWLNDQKGSVVDEVIGEYCIYSTAVERYQLITKNSPKPTLSDEAYMEFAAPQVVLHQTKDINAVFCVIWRGIKTVVQSMLRHHNNIFMFADMDPDSFADLLTEKVSTKVQETFDSLEIDIKKYDKSQDLKVLLLECKLLRYFGVSEELVIIWFKSHVESIVKDRRSGLKFKVQVQRRSGDGGTFIGNTLFLIALCARNFDLRKLKLAVFSGDDSLLVGEKRDLQCDSQNFSDLFNLDVKFFPNFKYYHFCSKFLIAVEDRWYFIPDPVKLCIRLARLDLVNWGHIEEYRISLKDTTKYYCDDSIVRELSKAVCDRYPVAVDPAEVFRVVCSIVSSKDEFRLLFEEPLACLPEGNLLPVIN
nr:RNA-dependent RNA polymerase [Citrus leprosis virus C]